MLRTSLCLLLYVAQCFCFKKLGEFEVARAAFSNVFVHEGATDPTEKYSIILSSFNPIPFTRDDLFMYRHIGKYLDSIPEIKGQSLSRSLTWPREPSQVPNEVFGFEAVSQPDGFLVPFKNRGSINIVDLQDPDIPATYDIVTDPDDDQPNWFYHRTIWKDMNGDGRLDAVTCRARLDSDTGEFVSEFLWLDHPEEGKEFGGPWGYHVINNNIGDVFLIQDTLTVKGEEFDVILTAGYFSQKLAVHWTNHPDGLWTDNKYIETRIIDVGHQFFDFELVDLNIDGRIELLVSLNAEVNGSMVVYEIPDDFRTGEYILHVLADGFNATSGMQGGGSPGSCGHFYPSTSDTQGRPWIWMSGDDEGTTYLFSPNSDGDWSFDQFTIVDEGVGNIVGKPSVADVNGDGAVEIFVPSYSKGLMYIFTFAE